MRILIAENDPESRRTLEASLSERGYEVTCVKTGAEVEAHLDAADSENELPGLIILDVSLPDQSDPDHTDLDQNDPGQNSPDQSEPGQHGPEQNGCVICEHLKAHQRARDIPVLFVGEQIGERERVRCFEVGGVDYIARPYSKEEVAARVRTHLTIGELQQSLREENALRDDAESTLANLNEELELLVEHRTGDLIETNEQLRREIAERKRMEEEIRASLRQKEILLKEIHHRVKNNMQIISSLLSLQSNALSDEHARALFLESQNRVRSMALIHEKLYRSAELEFVNFAEYSQGLANHLLYTYSATAGSVNIDIRPGEEVLDIETSIPCGLIVNELISNSLKHAFPEGRGTISIDLHELDGNYILEYRDDGVGFPNHIDFRNTESLGMQLVCNLTEQLEGTIEKIHGPGTRFKLIFSAHIDKEE